MKPGVVRGEGLLRHCFHGEYTAVLALRFVDEASARDALRELRAPWVPGEGANVLIARFSSQGLKAEKRRLVGYGADSKKIDSVRRSVDYGEPFEVSIPVVPSEQCGLFSEAVAS